jgi:branched-chain amino acid transport system ATP-binding protein
MSADLVVDGLSVSYGMRVAVDDISFLVGGNECVALIGANGAGKTSTLKALVGIEKARAGTVTYGGEVLSGRTPRQIAQAGVTLCPEGRHLFPAMSVHDNLLLGATSAGGSRQEIAALVDEMESRFPVLGQRRKQLAGTLSGGEQQMVAIARALMARPRLLILDEPTLGLAPMLVEQVLAIARSVVDSGCAVLISEQNVEATLEICDRAYVLEAGKVTASGTARELAHDPKLLAAFIGLEEATTAF